MTAASQTPAGPNFFVGAISANGTAGSHMDGVISFSFIGLGLTAAQVASLYKSLDIYHNLMGWYDKDAQTYIDTVVAQGVTVSDRMKKGFSRAYWDWKFNSLYPSIKAAGWLAHSAAGGNSINMITPTGTAATYTGSPTHTSNGIVFNGTSQHSDLGVTMALTTQNSAGLGVYVQTMATINSTYYIGAVGSGGSAIARGSAATSTSYSVNASSNTAQATVPNQFLFGTRNSSGSSLLYRNTTVAPTDFISSGAITAINLYLGARNSAGSPNGHAACTISYWMLTTGLTASQVTSNNNIVELLHDTAGIGLQ
jgi:hypothetical protein